MCHGSVRGALLTILALLCMPADELVVGAGGDSQVCSKGEV